MKLDQTDKDIIVDALKTWRGRHQNTARVDSLIAELTGSHICEECGSKFVGVACHRCLHRDRFEDALFPDFSVVEGEREWTRYLEGE